MKLDKKTISNIKTVTSKAFKGLPLLKYVCVKNNMLRVTDLSVSYKRILTEVSIDGIYEIIGNDIEKNSDDGDVSMNSFPEEIDFGKKVATVNREDFINLFKKANAVKSIDKVRVVLLAVHLKVEKNKIRIAGTDGRRLFCDWLSVKTNNSKPAEYLISNPDRVLKILKNMKTNTINIFHNEDSSTISFIGSVEDVQVKLINGTFPKIEQILTEKKSTFEMDRKLLVDGLKGILPYAKANKISKYNPPTIKIKYSIKKINDKVLGILTFLVIKKEHDKIIFEKKIEIPAEKKSKEYKIKNGFLLMPLKKDDEENKNTITLNLNYLLEILTCMDKPKVKFGFKEDCVIWDSPMHIVGNGEIEKKVKEKKPFREIKINPNSARIKIHEMSYGWRIFLDDKNGIRKEHLELKK